MKFPIAWHENCLRNQAASLLRRKGELDRATREFGKAMADHKHYAAQLEKAKKLKKDGFDSYLFMKQIKGAGRDDRVGDAC